jgi:hypothetical protein
LFAVTIAKEKDDERMERERERIATSKRQQEEVHLLTVACILLSIGVIKFVTGPDWLFRAIRLQEGKRARHLDVINMLHMMEDVWLASDRGIWLKPMPWAPTRLTEFADRFCPRPAAGLDQKAFVKFLKSALRNMPENEVGVLFQKMVCEDFAYLSLAPILRFLASCCSRALLNRIFWPLLRSPCFLIACAGDRTPTPTNRWRGRSSWATCTGCVPVLHCYRRCCWDWHESCFHLRLQEVEHNWEYNSTQGNRELEEVSTC